MRFGSLAGFALFVINVVFGWSHFHFLYAAPILTALDAAILVVVSLRNPALTTARGDIRLWKFDLSQSDALRLKGLPYWQDYRFQASHHHHLKQPSTLAEYHL